MEGRLGRIIGRIRGADSGAVRRDAQINTEERARTLVANVNRYNQALERISGLGLSDEAITDIGIAVRAGIAVQRTGDDIVWRRALHEEGLTLREIEGIHARKDAVELRIEVETPRFERDAQDPTS